MSELAAPDVASASDAAEGAPDVAPEAVSFAGTKHRVKVDETELDVTYDELVRGYQKGRAAGERFQRAAEMHKAVESFVAKARAGDLDWLDDVVPDGEARKWAERRLLRHIEWENLTPEQRELVELRRDKMTLEQEREAARQSEHSRQAVAAEQRAIQEIDGEIAAAVAALGKKPSPRLVRRIAEQMMASLSDPDGSRMPADEATKRAYRGLVVDTETLLSEMSPEEVLALLERAGKRDLVRRAYVDEAVSQAPSRSQASPDVPDRRQGKLKRMTTDEWFSRLDKKVGGPR